MFRDGEQERRVLLCFEDNLDSALLVECCLALAGNVFEATLKTIVDAVVCHCCQTVCLSIFFTLVLDGGCVRREREQYHQEDGEELDARCHLFAFLLS